MTSPQAENYDLPSSDAKPIDGLLDVLFDSDSALDNSSATEQKIEQSEGKENLSEEASLDSPERERFDDIAEFEKLVAQSSSPAKESLPKDKQNGVLEAAVQSNIAASQATDGQKQQDSLSDNPNKGVTEECQSALEIKTESATTEELAAAVNTLIPLVVELIKYKIENTQESILRGVTPVVERIIEQRSDEEPQKMAAAIAKILPAAISEKINLSPEEIAKAIAPEIAISIKEQIRLDEHAISEALGSEMGKAIKTQIEVEKDAMVDALYPVIGDTISKYMVEVVQEINRKVEKTLSPEGLKRKIKARLKGVSEAELILQESVGCHVQAVFLIDKDSGLIIQEVQQAGTQTLDSDLMGGMLTAIRSFANDCIVSGSELDNIDYGNWQIHLEAAGYCYLAVVLRGDPTKKFITRIRSTFGEIILNHGEAIEKFSGNQENISPTIKDRLAELLEPEKNQEKKASSPTALLFLVALILAVVIIPLGITNYRSRVAQNIEQTTAIQLDAAPELSVYRLEPRVNRGELIVTGRLPSEGLRSQAAKIGNKIAVENNLQFNNQITTVDVPVNPSLLAGEIKRLTEFFNRQSGASIETAYKSRTLTIEGFILDKTRQKSIIEAFARIPGIRQITVNIANQLPRLEERIYFESADNKVNLANNSSKIESTIEFLKEYPQLNLKLIAYNDGIGSKQINQTLGRQRCNNLIDALVAKGIDQSRLVADCSAHRTSQKPREGSLRLTRYVEFKPFIPSKQSSKN